MPDEDKSFLKELLGIVTAVTPMQWVASLIGLLTIAGMVWVIVNGGEFLQDPLKARGLITFSVAIVTVAIALIMVFYLVFATGSSDEIKDRFGLGKDILLVFVGILGTIMGFYYGSNTVSSDKYAALAEKTESVQKSPVDELEKKGFVSLLAKDFDGASVIFADAYKLNPTYHNIDEINKLFIKHKKDFADAAADPVKKDLVWKDIFCTITEKKQTLGMLPEMIAQVKKNCPPAPTPTTTLTPTNSSATPNSTQ